MAKGEDIRRFFSQSLWELEPERYGRLRGRLLRYFQIFVLVLRDFQNDQCLLRASALTFTTLLSIVPFFALAFAVLKWFGVQNTLEPFLLEQVAAGSQEIVQRIISYINNTQVGSLGAVGLAGLIVSVVMLLANIEESFNAIWGVRETRSIFRKFSDYLSVLVSGPVLLIAATSITTTLESQRVVQWIVQHTYLGDLVVTLFRLVPYLSVWLALVFLYVFIPNTHVRLRSALVGGVLAGTLWQGAQWGYIHFQVGVARYNAIYGTIAVLPVFMVWLYTGWLIVLLGVEMVYAHQHIRTYRRELRAQAVNCASRERLALALMLEICRAFFDDRPPLTAESLAERLDVPERFVHEVVDQLLDGGWVALGAGEPPVYLPAHELEHIQVKGVLDSLRSQGVPCRLKARPEGNRVVEDLFERTDQAVAASLGTLSFRELMEAPAPGNIPEKEG